MQQKESQVFNSSKEYLTHYSEIYDSDLKSRPMKYSSISQTAQKHCHISVLQKDISSTQDSLYQSKTIETEEHKSPVNSPLEGLKRSVADSTISDDQLLQNYREDYTESHCYEIGQLRSSVFCDSPSSPPRISLDDRINQVLGIEIKQKSGMKTNSQTYNQQYYQQYDTHQDQRVHYNLIDVQNVSRPKTHTKVLQVGNVLEVVPSEDIPLHPPVNTTQKILQVGNVLQIVPTVIEPVPPIVHNPSIMMPEVSVDKDMIFAEELINQTTAERNAERERKILEKENRKREKEKRRQERERRKSLKFKVLKSDIKKALLLETEGAIALGSEPDGQIEEDSSVRWSPVPVIISSVDVKPSKGILLSHGFRLYFSF